MNKSNFARKKCIGPAAQGLGWTVTSLNGATSSEFWPEKNDLDKVNVSCRLDNYIICVANTSVKCIIY